MALLAIALAVSVGISAQDKTSNFSMGADLVSRYIWRGVDFGGPSPHIQPYLEYAFGNTGLTLGTWASQSVGGISTGAEADLYLNYEVADLFTVGVTDYYFPSDQCLSKGWVFQLQKQNNRTHI